MTAEYTDTLIQRLRAHGSASGHEPTDLELEAADALEQLREDSDAAEMHIGQHVDENDRLRAAITEALASGSGANEYDGEGEDRMVAILSAAVSTPPAKEEPFEDPEPWRSVFPKSGGGSYYRFPTAIDTGMGVQYFPRTRERYEADRQSKTE